MDPQPTAPVAPPANVTPAAAPAPAADPPMSPIPATWPGAFGVYKYSKQAVKINLGPIILTFVGTFAGNFILTLLLGSAGRFLSYFVSTYFTACLTILVLAGTRQEKMSLGSALGKGASIYLKFLLLSIMVFFSIVVSLILLIIPVIFVYPRVALALYFLVDKNMGAVEAYKASWATSNPHKSKVWNILGVNILICLLFITIIGIPFAIYFLLMYVAAYAVLYGYINNLSSSQPAPAVAAIPSPTPPVGPTPPTVMG